MRSTVLAFLLLSARGGVAAAAALLLGLVIAEQSHDDSFPDVGIYLVVMWFCRVEEA